MACRCEARTGETLGVLADASTSQVLQLQHVGELVRVDPVGVEDEPVRVREREGLGAEVDQLLDGVLGDVAASGDQAPLACQVLTSGCQHLLGEVHDAVTGGLRPDLRASPVDALAGDHTGELVGDPLVLPEQETDLPTADADVARRHIGELADVTVELGHEALAEAAHLAVALALRVEIGTALGPTHGQGGEGVLEHLLESEELQQTQVDRRVEPEPAFVRSDGAVHLDSVAAVDLDLTVIVDPAHPEHDHPLGLDEPLEDLHLAVLRETLDDRLEGGQYLTHRL